MTINLLGARLKSIPLLLKSFILLENSIIVLDPKNKVLTSFDTFNSFILSFGFGSIIHELIIWICCRN